ncbi:phosphopantetheine-binding protein [bacterium]|nr:phosphopantetheine-binding protein [bacterium]
MSEVAENVIKFIRESLRVDESEVITPETNIIMELDGDSLDVIEIVIDIEEHYDINIMEEELAKVMLVGDLIKIVEDAIAEQS